MVNNNAAFQVGVGTILHPNTNHDVSWHQGANGLCFIYIVLKFQLEGMNSWSQHEAGVDLHISLFPATQVICNPVC